MVVIVGLSFGDCEDLYICGEGLVLNLHCLWFWLDFLLSSTFFRGRRRYVLCFIGLYSRLD